MRLLLDTHIFLWFILNDERLPEPSRTSIEAEANEVFLSAVSVWEIAIKSMRGLHRSSSAVDDVPNRIGRAPNCEIGLTITIKIALLGAQLSTYYSTIRNPRSKQDKLFCRMRTELWV